MFRKNELMIPKHINMENISFNIFTNDDMKKLSVTKITTPLTFDSLGHPLNGGLYDKSLGPMTEKSDPCRTCQKNLSNCPGHFGYIELPLPVVNPIFHKTIGMILKISCLNCYCLQIPVHIKKALSIQIKLLNGGRIAEAVNIESMITNLLSKYESLETISEECLLPIYRYEEMNFANLDQLPVFTKNTEALRIEFITGIFKMVKQKKLCLYCKKPLNKIQSLKNKIILGVKKTDGNLSAEARYVDPESSRRFMREIWKQEKELLQNVISVLRSVESQEYPTDIFYFDILPVPPPNVRPVNVVAGKITENSQSNVYRAILQNTAILNTVMHVMKNGGKTEDLPIEAKAAYVSSKGESAVEKLNNLWVQIQAYVDGIMDKEINKQREIIGLKQIIEKKAGIIRMHMMGKRVNYSARSVIAPDPNLNIDEIGIPEAFAKHLTYPVPVTSWNVEELRKMIMNGPNVHPGAVMVQFENGSIIRLNPKNPTQQESILKRLLTPDDDKNGAFKGVKLVYRHLCNGDTLLLNRQPTLHKPSIMAHKARILKGEKTLRLHYSNCKAYNADFDGDEMNAHFPQNELAKSEGYNLVNVCNQYLVPKDGTPLGGLIQDHMIAGVKLSVRGRFFNWSEYHHLVYQALSYKTTRIILLPPAIIKPVQLWSGKEILSTVLINIIPQGKELINLTASSKIRSKAWETCPPRSWKCGGTPFKNENEMSEAEVIIRKGNLLAGVLDKNHYGATPFGLIHCIFELYGGTCATRMLSCLSKLFISFLQQEGFTLGVRDILTIPKADKGRKKVIKTCRKIGWEVMRKAVNIPGNASLEEVMKKVDESSINPKLRASIDREYKTTLDSYTNDINRICLSEGLFCEFPANNLQLMVTSGAKGSTVNTMQISCLLGQIELEGKRPPLMISAKSLPSFPAFEFAPRAGGFIDGRFMTGIQPQEFFFHCMAGREGLIDTAVKTSRSGYLQRCLIKHLEGLTVGYDMTVRDSDGSVTQFMYGEDGMDTCKAQFLDLKHLNFLHENQSAILDKEEIEILKHYENAPKLEKHLAEINTWKDKHGSPLSKVRRSPISLFSQVIKEKAGSRQISKEDIFQLWQKSGEDIKKSFIEKCLPCPDTLNSIFQPDSNFDSINERIDNLITNFKNVKSKKDKKKFRNMVKLKAMKALCAPGEPVGLLAAQSIGEPSTQMTLNTFHFAGRGEMNVTLGIPRLREILMLASKNIKTPSMEIPFLPINDLEMKSEALRKKLNRVVVSDILEKVDVTVNLELKHRRHKYTLKFFFLPYFQYKNDYCVNPKYIMKHMARKFFTMMFQVIRKYSKFNSSNMIVVDEHKQKARKGTNEGDDESPENIEHDVEMENVDNNSSDDEPEDAEDAKMKNKFQERHDDHESEEQSDEEDISEEKTEMDSDEYTEVVQNNTLAQNFISDKENFLWCEITFALPLNHKKLDLTPILREVAAKSVIWETQHIKRAITYMKEGILTLRTDGINIIEMFKYHDILNLSKFYCNDIHKMAETYGIEAATKIIVKEVQDVFNVYGITVNPRHLSLVAEYMTFNGTFEPLSRKGMASSASPFQQMSFESSLAFLKDAVIQGKQDQLQNPSSSLMVGKPCNTGTGSFTLLQNLV
ncbi:hypothetical protein WA026_020509 [Henosepilachna vigintioctopunctata]|uniref:DNA-directed RNA polymerase subunit n=1 Tax=Henosepilachna vigintioctopunctata TaxID=420089 RepID=A0AAW1VG35_9CUCU